MCKSLRSTWMTIVAGALAAAPAPAQNRSGAVLLAPEPLRAAEPVARAANEPLFPPTGQPLSVRSPVTPAHRAATEPNPTPAPATGRYCPDCQRVHRNDEPHLLQGLFSSESDHGAARGAAPIRQASHRAMGSMPPTGVPMSQPVPVTYGSRSPAYRWYGYGTTTAAPVPTPDEVPTPKVSEEWLHQTGATAGAFPIQPTTTENWSERAVAAGPPVRQSEQPPAAVVEMSETFPVSAVDPAPTFLPNGLQFPENLPPTFPGRNSPDGAARDELTPPPPIPFSVRGQDGGNTPHIVARSQSPGADESALAALVERAAGDGNAVTRVERTSDGTLWVRMTTTSVAAARAGVDRISRLAELAHERVEFAVDRAD